MIPTTFKLEEYDPLAKRRAVLQHSGDGRWEPCAWIDYDDVSKEEADQIANAVLAGLYYGYGRDPQEGVISTAQAMVNAFGCQVVTDELLHDVARTRARLLAQVGELQEALQRMTQRRGGRIFGKRMITRAYLVAEHWRKHAINWGDLEGPLRLGAHPLCCVLAALDGEADPAMLGVTADSPEGIALTGLQ